MITWYMNDAKWSWIPTPTGGQPTQPAKFVSQITTPQYTVNQPSSKDYPGFPTIHSLLGWFPRRNNEISTQISHT